MIVNGISTKTMVTVTVEYGHSGDHTLHVPRGRSLVEVVRDVVTSVHAMRQDECMGKQLLVQIVGGNRLVEHGDRITAMSAISRLDANVLVVMAHKERP